MDVRYGALSRSVTVFPLKTRFINASAAILMYKEAVVAVAIDLSKAFDSIDHSLLLAKLSAYGLSSSALQLISSYLTARKQRVKVHGICSSYRDVKVGVTQGSLLGPLLFNIFINDLNFFVPHMSLRLYADDTTGYYSDTSPTVLQFVANSELSVL